MLPNNQKLTAQQLMSGANGVRTAQELMMGRSSTATAQQLMGGSNTNSVSAVRAPALSTQDTVKAAKSIFKVAQEVKKETGYSNTQLLAMGTGAVGAAAVAGLAFYKLSKAQEAKTEADLNINQAQDSGNTPKSMSV